MVIASPRLGVELRVYRPTFPRGNQGTFQHWPAYSYAALLAVESFLLSRVRNSRLLARFRDGYFELTQCFSSGRSVNAWFKTQKNSTGNVFTGWSTKTDPTDSATSVNDSTRNDSVVRLSRERSGLGRRLDASPALGQLNADTWGIYSPRTGSSRLILHWRQISVS
jgi:hypothetical protein